MVVVVSSAEGTLVKARPSQALRPWQQPVLRKEQFELKGDKHSYGWARRVGRSCPAGRS